MAANNTKKKTARSTPARAKKNTATRKKTGEATRASEIIGLLVVAFGLFLLVCMISPRNAHWVGQLGVFFKDLLFGIAGLFGYVLPVVVMIIGVFIIMSNKRQVRVGKVVTWTLFALFLLCLIHMFALRSLQDAHYGTFIHSSYGYSKASGLGGGALASLIVFPLLKMLGIPGTYILLCAGLLICIILVTNFSIRKASQNVSSALARQAEERRERRQERKAQQQLYTEDLAQSSDGAGERVRDDAPFADITLPDGDMFLPHEQPAAPAAAPAREEPLIILPKESEKTVIDAIPAPPKGMKKTMDDTPITVPDPSESMPDKPYVFPPTLLLTQAKLKSGATGNGQDIRQKAKLLEDTLRSFDVEAKVIQVSQGPVVTRYELQPAAGVKVSRIVNLADDIALNMASAGVRIEAPIPGKAAIGIEVPNAVVSTVTLREIIESEKFKNAPSKLSFALGKDIAGNHVIADIARMPHLLVAGSTGSGKSVCINAMLTSLLYKSTPEEVRLILIDPKVVELSVYNGIPHLLIPVVTDPKKAAGALAWAVAEMTRRYQCFAETGVRDLERYNELMLSQGKDKLPQIVVVIDELADLMMVASKEVENSIMRLAQMARAAGLHLVIATQRPSVDVITGVIKANIASRIAFAVSSQVDSRTILDSAGAERLLGRGDMLFNPSGALKPLRVQGAFVSDAEVERVIEYIKKHSAQAEYSQEVLSKLDSAAPGGKGDASDGGEEDDPLLHEAIDVVIDSGQASISMLQRRLRVGYARAGHLIDAMEQRGIVSGFDGSKPRQVLITREQFAQMNAPKDGAEA
nr:DNA translocase FtsK [Maliibacterium massiliense]